MQRLYSWNLTHSSRRGSGSRGDSDHTKSCSIREGRKSCVQRGGGSNSAHREKKTKGSLATSTGQDLWKQLSRVL